jgi:hypothetical protein
MEYRVTFAITAPPGTDQEQFDDAIVALLDRLIGVAPGHGPVTSHAAGAAHVHVTLALDAPDALAALSDGRQLRQRALGPTRLHEIEVVDADAAYREER